MAMLVCPNCGRKVWSEASRCNHCGTPMEAIRRGLQGDDARQALAGIIYSLMVKQRTDAKSKTDATSKTEAGQKTKAEQRPHTESKPRTDKKPASVMDRRSLYRERYHRTVEKPDIHTYSVKQIFRKSVRWILCIILFLIISAVAFFCYFELSKPSHTLRCEQGIAEVYYDDTKYDVQLDCMKENEDTCNWKQITLYDSDDEPVLKGYMVSSEYQVREGSAVSEVFRFTVVFSTDSLEAYIATYWERRSDSDLNFTSDLDYLFKNELIVMDGEGEAHLFNVPNRRYRYYYDVNDPQGIAWIYKVDDPLRLARLFAENERLYVIVRDENKLGNVFMLHPLYGKKREKILWMVK